MNLRLSNQFSLYGKFRRLSYVFWYNLFPYNIIGEKTTTYDHFNPEPLQSTKSFYHYV